MADEKNKINDEDAPSEDQKAEDAEDPGDREERDEEGKGPGRVLEGLNRLRRLPRSLFKGKWIWVSLSGLVILGLGFALISRHAWTAPKEKEGPGLSQNKAVPENFYEETLSPFFIPLHPESPKGLMMVDFSMIWDGVAAIRFKQKELQIRETVYAHLVKLAAKKKDISERTSYLESEMKKIFRETMGRDDLEVKIKEIKTF
ncbi:MAG: hypothetical protein ABII06_22090 [Pseudomonadota bacterium]